MNTIEHKRFSLGLAAAILLKKGKVSVEDIHSLPFIDDHRDHRAIIESLLSLYDAEIVSQQISSTPYPKWEEVVQLKYSHRGTTLNSGNNGAHSFDKDYPKDTLHRCRSMILPIA